MHLREFGSMFVAKPESKELAVAAAEEEPNTQQEAADDRPELDIVINNVVCSFNVHCHLNLRWIALNGLNVELKRENGMVTMRLRRPYTTASVWSSGRITCTGATSELQAKVAARRFARCLGKLGFAVSFRNFRIFNVLGTCSMPWAIRIVKFSERHRNNASYEPELHPGVTYKMADPKATLKIFSTGSITVTAASVDTVESAIQRIYPLVFEYRNENTKKDLQEVQLEQQLSSKASCRLPNTSWRPKPQIYSSSRIFDSTPTNLLTHTASSNALSSAFSCSTGYSNSSSAFSAPATPTPTPTPTPTLTPSPTATPTPTPTPTSTPSSSSSSGGDNILANARRRATECWVSKMQNKRLRFNDVYSMSKFTDVARSVAANKPTTSKTCSGSSTGIVPPNLQLKSYKKEKTEKKDKTNNNGHDVDKK